MKIFLWGCETGRGYGPRCAWLLLEQAATGTIFIYNSIIVKSCECLHIGDVYIQVY